MEGNYKKWLNRINSKQDRLQDVTGNVGVGKTDASATEKLDVNGNVKADNLKVKSTQFQLQSFINPTPNTLVPKTDGSGLEWFDNNSVKPFLLLYSFTYFKFTMLDLCILTKRASGKISS